MNCKHVKTCMMPSEEKILGETFTFTGEHCMECGAVAWTETTYDEFYTWLENLYKENKDKFTLQKIRLPKAVWDFIYTDLRKEVRGEIPLAVIIRSATWIYINMVARQPSFSRGLEKYFDSQDQTFVARDAGEVKIRFNPKFFLEIHQWAKRLNMTEKEFVENAATRVIYGTKWHDEIKRSLIERLQAA